MNLIDDYKNRYLIYTRRSTDDTHNQRNSIAYQVEAAQQFAQTHEQPLLLADFTHSGFAQNGVIKERHSAFKTAELHIKKDGTARFGIERPKFQILVSLLVQGAFKGVICLCWDRLSRNDQDKLLIQGLMVRGVDIRFVQTTYELSSAGFLHMDIDSMFAKHASQKTSERVRATGDKMRREGKCLYRTPIGYLDQGPDNKPFDKNRAPIVRRIFELYSTGDWSFRELARWANQQGLTAKPVRRRRTLEERLADEEVEIEAVCRPICKKSIENILSNPFYISKIYYKGDTLDGNHQPLIGRRLFNKVQTVLASRSRSVHYVDKKFFTYRGLIRCGCGRAYSPYAKKGHSYYGARCKPGCANKKRNLAEHAIDNIVDCILGQVYISDHEASVIDKATKESLNKRAEQREKSLKDLLRIRRQTYADLGYLKEQKITLLRTGAMEVSEYAKERERLEAKLGDTKYKLTQLQDKEGETTKHIFRFSELIKGAKESYKIALDTEKRDLCIEMFSELVIMNGNLATCKPKEGFKTLFKIRVGKLGDPSYPISELSTLNQELKFGIARLSKLPMLRAKDNKMI